MNGKGRKRALVAALVVALVPSFAAADFMATQYQPNLEQGVCQAMIRAADFLVSAQQCDAEGSVGWSWIVGEGPNSGNIAALASLALLQAYQASDKLSYLTAATRYADSLLAKRDQWTVENLPYKADIELLVDLSQEVGNVAYLELARSMFEVIRARSPSGIREVNRIAAGRKAARQLLGFDVALAIRAALSVGQHRYAYELADEVVRRLPQWYDHQKDPRFTLVSAAALVRALEALDAGHYRKTIGQLRKGLLRFQQGNGSWLANETQTSAYAVLAMMGSNLSQEREAAIHGLKWLKSTMLSSGSFATFNDYLPEPFVGEVISEVHAEVLSALSVACGEE